MLSSVSVTTERATAWPALAGGSQFVAIDSNGNLASKLEDGHSWTYEWNAENQLKRVLKDSVEVARFAYDPAGRRVERVAGGITTTYLYDGEDILKQLDGASTVRYVHGPGIDEPMSAENGAGPLTYEHADGLGSELKQTDATGAVTFSRSYDAFGQLQVGASLSGYAFTGREWEPEAGLHYYRARYYDPKLARFISEDPIGLEGGDVNLYAYVWNAPATFADSSGLSGSGFGAVPYPTKPGVGGGIGSIVTMGHAVADFIRNYNDMRHANTIGADKYFHCMANCQAARRGPESKVVAVIISEGREGVDQYVKRDPPAACNADRSANSHGRGGNPSLPCRTVCAPFRPQGLPPQY